MTKLEAGLDRGGGTGSVTPTSPFQLDIADTTLATPNSAPSWPLIPWARGPLSAAVINALQPGRSAFIPPPLPKDVDVLNDDDFQLALYLSYATSHRLFNTADLGMDARFEGFRTDLERTFESRLRAEAERWEPTSKSLPLCRLDELLIYSRISLLAKFVSEFGNLDHLRELCVHLSVIHVHDNATQPLAFGVPPATWANTELGRGERHRGGSSFTAQFRHTMAALGLDPTRGSYVEMTPAPTLALANLTTMFAKQLKFRSAYMGQLAAMLTSSAASAEQISRALGKFGIDERGRRYFDYRASVEPRAARTDRDRRFSDFLETELDGLLFGAIAVRVLERNLVTHLLSAWEHKSTSLAPWVMSD